MNKENVSKLWKMTILDARKSLEFVTAVYDSTRQNKIIEIPIDKNNSLYSSWMQKNSTNL
tara:strand:- start:476 stop:655 length:180 start_codon:yes stop_codon:yes gene_type:complete